MSDTNNPETEPEKPPKCTRGVKCILIHILVTVVVLFILLTIYVVHLLVVQHRGLEAFRISRRSSAGEKAVPLAASPETQLVGAVFVAGPEARVACCSVLVRARWSLAPAHCVSTRADPDHSKLLPSWRIRYNQRTYQETDIKRGLVHSFFNKDDFDNNIGLFQHLDEIDLPPFKFSNKAVSDLLAATDQDLYVVGWTTVDETYNNKARVLNSRKCSEFVTPIVDAPRPGEACLQQYVGDGDAETEDGVHGAALLVDSAVVAFVSWGDRGGRTPQVLLLIAPYRTWIEDMIELQI